MPRRDADESQSPFGREFPFGGGMEMSFGSVPFRHEMGPNDLSFPFRRDMGPDDPPFPFRRAMRPNDYIFHVHGNQYNVRMGGNSQRSPNPLPYATNLSSSSLPNLGGDNIDVYHQRPKAKHPNRSPNRNARSSVHVERARSAGAPHHVDGENDNYRGSERLLVNVVNVHDPPDAIPHDRNPTDIFALSDQIRINNWRSDVAAYHPPLPTPTTHTESSITLCSTGLGVKRPSFMYHYVALCIDKTATIKRLDDEYRTAIQRFDSTDPDDQGILAKLKSEYEVIAEVVNNFTLAQCVGWIDKAPAPDDPNGVESQDPDIYYVRLLRRDDPDEPCSNHGISVHPNDRVISGIRPLKFDAYDKSEGKRNIQLPWDTKYYHHWGDVLPVRILPAREDDKDGYFNRYELSLEERERFHRGSEAYFANMRASSSSPNDFWEKRGIKGTLFTMTFNRKFPAKMAHPKLFTDLHDLFANRFKGR